jgi:glycosyltransferase involved in cell wall biosynthesis
MRRHIKTLRKRADRAAAAICKRAYVSVAAPLSIALMQRSWVIDRLVEKVAGAVEEVHQDGGRGPAAPRNGRLSILALSPETFRRDLEVLAACRELRMLRMSTGWQRRMLRWFHGIWPSELEVHNPQPGSGAARARRSYQCFLREFLRRLYRRLGVDVVVGANVRYREDLDWGAVSQALGVPYVVLHRENLPVREGSRIFERIRSRYESFGAFTGECVVVHNSSTPNYFLKANYIDADRIHVLGCLRMDPYLLRLQQPRPIRSRPLVLLFSFRTDSPTTFGRSGYYPPFRDSHGALALLAKQHPELDVLIRPKPRALTNRVWNRDLRRAFQDWGVDPDNLPTNLQIDTEGDAQDLILSASVVVGLNSTTLVEAAISGLPVIMSNFRYLRNGAHSGDVLLREYDDVFDMPDTGEELIEMVLRRLRNPSVPDDIMQRRRHLFANAVSPLDGEATERYVKLLKRVVSGQRKTHAATAVTEAAAIGR